MPWSTLRLARAANGEFVAVGPYSEAAGRLLETAGFQRPPVGEAEGHWLPASVPASEQQMRLAAAEDLLTLLPVTSLARDTMTFGEMTDAVPEARTLKDLATITDHVIESGNNPVADLCHFADRLAQRIAALVPEDAARDAQDLIERVQNDAIDALNALCALPEQLLHRARPPAPAPAARTQHHAARPTAPPAATPPGPGRHRR